MVRNGCSKTLSLLTLSVLWAAAFGSACQSGQDHSRIVVRQGECLVCHQGDLDQVTSPPHDSFPSTCGTCHGQDAWSPASFTHAWPLTGAHETTACASCHLGDPPVYLARPPFASAAIRMITTTAPSRVTRTSRRPARTATRRSHGRLRRVATIPRTRSRSKTVHTLPTATIVCPATTRISALPWMVKTQIASAVTTASTRER